MTVQPWQGQELETGLEDFGTTDMVVPRITIVHKRAVFKDNLTNQEFDRLNVVLLGLVKQRVLWDTTVEEGDKPMCKSTNFEHGFPNMDDRTPKVKQFPWDKSNFTPADSISDNGTTVLPCAACRFKDWNTDPTGKKPWCNEQHTLPLLYDVGNENFTPALFTLAKSGLKPSKTYLTGFARSNRPTYTVYTEISLRPESRGDNAFAVPVFKMNGEVEDNLYAGYSRMYREMRDFLTRPPAGREDDESDGYQPSDNTNTPTPVESSSAASSKPTAPAPSAPASPAPKPPAADDDDLPF